ncbi:MAG: sulfotransferase [Bacteroidia bacterium]|nr:sulfotransferase [Bacteroidia bacterium]
MYLKPLFMIIGERKCGTSSLYRYLTAHPDVLPCQLKEPQFFSRDPAWIAANIASYEALFPLADDAGEVTYSWPELDASGTLYHTEVRTPRVPGHRYYTGEASANTFHEVAPALVHRHLPDIKLIVLLRDPVIRAWSHHRMYQRFAAEGRTLPVQVGTFEADMQHELERHAEGLPTEYLAPGIYIRNLIRWTEVYPRDQLRVLLTRSLETAPQAVLDDLLSWLGLRPHQYGDYLRQRFNQAPPDTLAPDTEQALRKFYAPHNEALATWLGYSPGW